MKGLDFPALFLIFVVDIIFVEADLLLQYICVCINIE